MRSIRKNGSKFPQVTNKGLFWLCGQPCPELQSRGPIRYVGGFFEGSALKSCFSKVRKGDPVRWWWQSQSPLLEPHTLEHVAVPWSRAGWPSSGVQVLEKASNSSSTRNLDGVRLDMWKPKHSFSPGICWHPFKGRLLMATIFFHFFQLSLWPVPGQRACGEFIMPRKILLQEWHPFFCQCCLSSS